MITQLSPILVTHVATIIVTELKGADEKKDGTLAATDLGDAVSVTVLLRPKDENKHKDFAVKITGPAAEIETRLGEEIRSAVKKITEFGTTMADLDAQIAEAKKEKEAVLKAEKAVTAKTLARTAPSKPPKRGEDAADGDGDGSGSAEPVVARQLQRPASAAKLTPAAPAIAAPPAAPAQQTLDDMGI